MATKVLLVDDDPQQRRYFAAILEGVGYDVALAAGGAEALERLGKAAEEGIAACLLDLQMPEPDGIEVLRRVRAGGVAVPIVALTSDGSVGRAVEAMQAGAVDFVVKPAGPERLDVSVRNAIAMHRLSGEVQRLSRVREDRLVFDDLVAVSPAARRAVWLARRAAASDIPVLIQGESGTGKEMFARALHGESARAGRPFVAVNCGALPATLVESILFGHEKGAFTGAVARRRGKFQEASGGTLFLDEIGELPLEAQVKLLRVLQTGEVDPVGGTGPVRADIRLISASNRDLAALTEAGRFRDDLFYRLSVFPLTLPPLRERREDIPPLARRFLDSDAARGTAPITGFTTEALEALARAPWPGNVRQLENAIHRALVLAEGPLIEAHDLNLPSAGGGAKAGEAPERPQEGALLDREGHVRRLRDIEADAIRLALRLYRGRMTEAARRLGIGRSTLYRKIDELQIDRDGG
ncbi:MAG TPA: sigma-54 dependent transcriptional regulator [Thermohalobaculum sp.]|nr:sigma-54 dependent transcriptional regulator [Thermohalobaculum sp.]